MKKTTPTTFQRGQSVEVLPDEEGFCGSHYWAIVLSPLNDRADYLVEYQTLTDDEEGDIPTREIVESAKVRPLPPEVEVKEFSRGDVVDAEYNDGWWVGVVEGKVRGPKGSTGDRYYVTFDNGEVIAFGMDRLRVHQEWEDGEWRRDSHNQELKRRLKKRRGRPPGRCLGAKQSKPNHQPKMQSGDQGGFRKV